MHLEGERGVKREETKTPSGAWRVCWSHRRRILVARDPGKVLPKMDPAGKAWHASTKLASEVRGANIKLAGMVEKLEVFPSPKIILDMDARSGKSNGGVYGTATSGRRMWCFWRWCARTGGLQLTLRTCGRATRAGYGACEEGGVKQRDRKAVKSRQWVAGGRNWEVAWSVVGETCAERAVEQGRVGRNGVGIEAAAEMCSRAECAEKERVRVAYIGRTT
jgi:hypothetical protein